MKYIDKNQSISIQGKTILETWKNNNKVMIERLCKNNETKALWRKFSVKKEIRTYLYKEQSGFCCYCGIGLTPKTHHTVIEHFKLKSGDPCNNMFDYNNLLLSCHGNAYDFYDAKKGDTWASIAVSQGKTAEWLKEKNPDIVLEANEPQEGEKLIVSTKNGVENHHCDKFRGDKDLPISPTSLPDCIDRIVYTVKELGEEGQVTYNIGDEDAKKMIENLNLKTSKLVKQRKAIVKDARSIYDELNENTESYEDLQDSIRPYLESVNSFFVVYRAYFKDEFPDLF